jgi:hypothetical protein
MLTVQKYLAQTRVHRVEITADCAQRGSEICVPSGDEELVSPQEEGAVTENSGEHHIESFVHPPNLHFHSLYLKLAY